DSRGRPTEADRVSHVTSSATSIEEAQHRPALAPRSDRTAACCQVHPGSGSYARLQVNRPRRCDRVCSKRGSRRDGYRLPRMSAKERREELIQAAIRVMVREGVAK